MSLINCPECNKEISNRASSCPNCGCPIVKQQNMSQPIAPQQEQKSRSTAILLSLLLGGIGAHKFYVDKPGAGVVYLLFCWTFIPAIFGLIEAIQYASMSNEVFQQKYLSKKL
jgi:TM2 domain-containing membrane protein YozV